MPVLERAVPFEIGEYLGKWYQISAFPAWFQKNCPKVTAVYTMKEGYIEVKNTCYRKDGKRVRLAKAFPTEKKNVLKVQFFAPFKADYIVEFVDKKYKYAVVGSSGKSYLWILAREPKISGTVYEQLVEKARKKGYDVSKLEK